MSPAETRRRKDAIYSRLAVHARIASADLETIDPVLADRLWNISTNMGADEFPSLQSRDEALRDVALACRRAMACIGTSDPLFARFASVADDLAPPGTIPPAPGERRPQFAVIAGGRA